MTEKSRPYIIGGAREAFPRPNQSGSKMKSKFRFIILGIVCLLATYVYYGLNRTSVDLEINSVEIPEQSQGDDSVTSDPLGDYNYDDENEDYDEDYEYEEEENEEEYTYYTDEEEKDALVKQTAGENIKEDMQVPANADTQVEEPVPAESESVDIGWTDSEEDFEDTEGLEEGNENTTDEEELIIDEDEDDDDDAANTVGGENDSPSIEELEQSFRQAELLDTIARNEGEVGSGMLPDDEDYGTEDDTSRDYEDEIDEAEPTAQVAPIVQTTESSLIQLQAVEAQLKENDEAEGENENYEFEIEEDDEDDDSDSDSTTAADVDIESSGDIESAETESDEWLELASGDLDHEEAVDVKIAEPEDSLSNIAAVAETADNEMNVPEVGIQAPELEYEESDSLLDENSGEEILDDIPPVRLMSDGLNNTENNDKNDEVNDTVKLPSFPPSGLQYPYVAKENSDVQVVVNNIPSTQPSDVQNIQMHEPTIQTPQLVAGTTAPHPAAPQSSHHLSFYKYHYQFTNPNKQVSYGTPLYLKSTVANKLQDAEPLKLSPVYDEFVFVVVTQSHQYSQTLEVIASIQEYFPRHFTFLYDLGLQPNQADHSKTLCNVIYKKYDYKAYPQTIADTIVDRQVHLSMIIHDAFVTSPGVLFLDNTMRIRSSNLSAAFSTAHANGGIAFFDSDNDVTFADLDLLNFFPSSSMLLSMPQIKPTAFLVYNTKVMLNNILWWWYTCSLDTRCMTTYSLTSCFTWKEQGLSYADCRLLDKSLLTVLSANYFDFNPKWYAVKTDTISKWSATENVAWRVNVCPLKA